MLQLRAQDPTRGVPFVPDPFSSVVPDAPFGAARPIKDNLYRLTLETVTDTLGALVYQKTFDYDPVGNRDTQATTGLGAGTIDYTYDDRDRLLTENGTTYGYDANGNLTSKSGEATYTWDFEDRLIRVDKTDGTAVEHVYDSDGVRIRTTTTPSGGSAEVTDFLVDTWGALSHVVAESEGGALVTYYVRGDDLLSLIRSTEQRYYHADGIGSIRFLSDELGSITDGYTYTAYGVELGHTGTDVQPYSFAGEPFDPNIAFYYNRARWLDAGVGRFVGMDPFIGVLHDPSSIHKYLYAGGDPINNVDPSGEQFTVGQLVALGAAIGVIGNIILEQPQTIRGLASATLLGAIAGGTGAFLAAVAGGLVAPAAIVGFFFTGGTAFVHGPLGRVTRQELVRAAASRGASVTVTTSQTVSPPVGRGFSVVVGHAEAFARTFQPTGTIYIARIPQALLNILIRIGLATQTTTATIKGVIETEIRFHPDAIPWVLRFFKQG